MLTFQDPLLFLFLPPIAIAMLWAARPGYAGLRHPKLSVLFALRVLTFALILAALSGTASLQKMDRRCVIFVVDVSRSMTPTMQASSRKYVQAALATKRPGDAAGVVIFGGEARVAAPPSLSVPRLTFGSTHVAAEATNLERALRLATTLFPADRAKKIVVLSDGAETAGDARAYALALQANHITVDVADSMASDNSLPPEILLRPLAMPARVAAGSPFVIPVHVWSSEAQRGVLTIRQDGKPIARRFAALPAGDSVWDFAQSIRRPGPMRYDVTLTAPRDTVASNNKVYSFVRAAGSIRILYVTANPGDGAELKTLLAASGIDVVIQAPSSDTWDFARLSQFDGVIVGDVTARQLGASAMLAIQSAARDAGVGLGMIGGERGFAAGGYVGTPMAEALPVEMERAAGASPPKVAVVVALDASGSMARLEDGVQKLQIGAKAVVQLMHALKPGDQIAVTNVRTQSEIVLPLQPAANTQPLEDAVDAMNAGGDGIYCRTALQDAYTILKRSNAPIRHVILVADTSDSEQPEGCVALVRRMKLDGITVSVCGIGNDTDRDVGFQRDLARAGGGQSVVIQEAEQLPALFVRDARQLEGMSYFERRVTLSPSANAPMLAGLPLDAMPPILGYDLLRAKAGVGVALATSGSHDPILAYGRYGQCRTFAFATDGAAHWTQPWAAWRGRRPFWAQLIRWFARSEREEGVRLQVEEIDGAGRVAVALPRGGKVSDWEAWATAPDATRTSILLNPTDARSAEGVFALSQMGAYSVTLSSSLGGAGSKTALFVVPYSPEFLRARPDRPGLIRLAAAGGGVYAQPPNRVFHDRSSGSTSEHDLTPLLLLLSAFCFLGDLACRPRRPRVLHAQK